MKQDEDSWFDQWVKGKCDFCLQDRLVRFYEHAGKLRDCCSKCEQAKAPYLKPSSNKKPEKIGNIRI